MLKKIGAAAALMLSLGMVPMASHSAVTNACVATDTTPGSAIGIGSLGALTCTYTAGSAAGQVVQSTPNQVHVTYQDPITLDTVELYGQDTLTPPGVGTWTNSDSIGRLITVTVGPDAGLGSIGVVAAGDAS